MNSLDARLPRRWRKKLDVGTKLFGRDREYMYGCYFPTSDLNVNEGARPGTGQPQDVEWLDADSDTLK